LRQQYKVRDDGTTQLGGIHHETIGDHMGNITRKLWFVMLLTGSVFVKYRIHLYSTA